MEFLHDQHFWFNVSFAIFAVVAWKFGKNAVISLLDGRIEDIRKEIESAGGLRVEAQELLAQYQRKHQDAVKDAQAIVETAEKQAAEILKKAEEELQDTAARREKQLQERLSRMENAAIEEIRQHAADLALSATAEIISAQLNKKTKASLVDDSIKGIGKNIH